MHLIDWLIVFTLLGFLIYMAISSRMFTKSVADFLAANRCAGRYLITVADGMAGLGAITIIGNFEMYYNAGFSAAWWSLIYLVVMTAMMLSGWIIYRFRQTRAFTLAQFLEMRYSKKFRIFAGFLVWFSGIINFGIFPAVGARFFMYYCSLPQSFLVGGLEISTYVALLVVLISVALFFTFLGGQVTVIVTDFVQGTLANIVFVVAVIALLCVFKWPVIVETLMQSDQASSLIHPFKTQQAKDFNLNYFLISAFIMFYASMVWQGNQGYNASAKNPHEARMGKILSTWRLLPMSIFMMMIPICAYTFFHHPSFAGLAQQANEVLGAIGSDQIKTQMSTPVAMSFFLPTGLMGAVAAVMLAAFISTHDTYLHSWGAVFVQDVIMPFRKKPLSQKSHLILLRVSIIGVAIFIFLFSLLFRQTDYIMMFFNITGAIFTGGAGAVVIGGLYWKRGTTAGAWSAMITGAVLAVGGIVIQQLNDSNPFTNPLLSYIASTNGLVLSFWASLAALLVYVIVSLVSGKVLFNMDKLLHRGEYAVEEDRIDGNQKVGKFARLVGINSDFNRKDTIIYYATVSWSAILLIVFVTGTVYNMVVDVPSQSWSQFWKYYLGVCLFISITTTIWFALGGIFDLKKMFRVLQDTTRDANDDGRVNVEGESSTSSTAKIEN